MWRNLLPGKILLSIAIPTFNRAEQLAFCLNSILEQSSQLSDKIEIVISNNNSSDATSEVVRKYARKFKHFRYVEQARKLSIEENANAVARLAKGKFLWLFGDDDYLEPNGLKVVVDTIKENDCHFYILNRSRANDDLSKKIVDNWMDVPDELILDYDTLLSFVEEWGFISIIGFYNASVFNRKMYLRVDAEKYYNLFLYAHLGAHIEAFSHSPVKLVGYPVFCHRTMIQDTSRRFDSDLNNQTFSGVRAFDDGVGMALFFDKLLEIGAIEARNIAVSREFINKRRSLLWHIMDRIIFCEKCNAVTEEGRLAYKSFLNKFDWASLDEIFVSKRDAVLAVAQEAER